MDKFKANKKLMFQFGIKENLLVMYNALLISLELDNIKIWACNSNSMVVSSSNSMVVSSSNSMVVSCSKIRVMVWSGHNKVVSNNIIWVCMEIKDSKDIKEAILEVKEKYLWICNNNIMEVKEKYLWICNNNNMVDFNNNANLDNNNKEDIKCHMDVNKVIKVEICFNDYYILV